MNSSQIEEALNTPDDEVKSLLSTILNMNLWNEAGEKHIITAINKMLTVSRSRLQGLEYLSLIINNCSARTISEHGNTWISHCLVKYAEDDLKELKLTTIGRIVENSHEEQEFSKKFISEHISKIFEMCLSMHNNTYVCKAALDTLAICMKHYGSWFAPHKLRLECFITDFLENSSESVVESAATVFHYFQQIGGAGIDGINHKNNFSTNFSKLCVAAQKLLDTFFENEIEIDQSDRSDQEAFEFTNLPHHTQKMLYITSRRIKNCLTFIKEMLMKGFTAEKEIRPGQVLDLVSRGSAIHRCLNANNDASFEDFQFSIILNHVQIELLGLLEVLIIWLHANALPFTFTITKILVDCLNKSQSCRCFKTDSLYQEMVYKVLGCWIRISKGALHSHFQTQLMKCILKDITPPKSNVSLNLSGDAHKNKSKKAIQKAMQDRIISSGHGNKHEDFTNAEKFNREKNCLFALDTLKQLLNSTILKLPQNIIQELYTSIINTLIQIQTSETSHPYTNPQCEAKLYEVFVAFYEQDTLKVLPPLQLAIESLNRGINSPNGTIAQTCERGLSILEKICQPVCPSLFISEAAGEAKELFTEDRLEETTNASELEQPSNEEANVDNVSSAENEDAIEKAAEETMEIVNEDVIEKEEKTQGILEPEPSVHIIDMQIIKTSISNMELNDEEDVQNVSDGEKVQESKEMQVPTQSNVEIQVQNGAIEPTENNEPPFKKVRRDETQSGSLNVRDNSPQNLSDDIFEEESTKTNEGLKEVIPEGSTGTPVVKDEEAPQNAEDDIFIEGDDFVDVVKDY